MTTAGRVSTQEHWGVMGMSQVSGKSTLVAGVLAHVPGPALLIDPAASAAFDRWPAISAPDDPLPAGVTRWQPALTSRGQAEGDAVGARLAAAYRQGNVLVVADEVADWPWLEAVARRGMQRGVAIWWLTQYATGCPRYLLSQTPVVWSGFQMRDVDLQRLEGATGVSWSGLTELPDYAFARWRRGERRVWYPTKQGGIA